MVELFGILYLLSPKIFTSEAEFAPVPWVLGGYFAFSLVKLAIVHRCRVPDWLLYLSVLLDMELPFVIYAAADILFESADAALRF